MENAATDAVSLLSPTHNILSAFKSACTSYKKKNPTTQANKQQKTQTQTPPRQQDQKNTKQPNAGVKRSRGMGKTLAIWDAGVYSKEFLQEGERYIRK